MSHSKGNRWKINESNFRARAFIIVVYVCFELEWETTGEQRALKGIL